MPVPGGEIQLKQSSLSLALISNRTSIVTNTITIGTAAAVGATSLSLTADAANVKLYAGQALSFIAATSPTGRQQAVLLDDVTLSTTAATVNIFPLISAIAANSTSKLVAGMLPVLGIQEFGLQSSDTDVDTTNTLSSIGTEVALIRSSKTFNISGIQIPGDRGLYQIVKPVCLEAAFFGREVYAILSLPDGEMFEGVAKVRNFSAPGSQNEVKKYTFELMIMGATFKYTSPHIFA
ncbi:MAG: hypothetical protein F6K28_59135 [Microcoleus sp. SIO2G3]|nr:hypothetical protein [Microcoleus sp. SIO2G3]